MNKLIATFIAATLATGAAFAQSPVSANLPALNAVTAASGAAVSAKATAAGTAVTTAKTGAASKLTAIKNTPTADVKASAASGVTKAEKTLADTKVLPAK